MLKRIVEEKDWQYEPRVEIGTSDISASSPIEIQEEDLSVGQLEVAMNRLIQDLEHRAEKEDEE